MASIVGRKSPESALQWSAAGHLLAGLLALVAIAWMAEVPAPGQGAAIYLLFAAALAIWLHRHGPVRSFGGANRITLFRLVMVSLLAGYVGWPEAVAWPLLGVAGVALLLDGVDGWWARRQGLASDFGARFDMEVDAALILILAALVWNLDKAGPWVILSGALRYLFVGAGWLWPFLRGPLPSSERRRIVCVVQVATLIACLAPILGPVVTMPLAAGALVLTAWSFAIDILWLHRQRSTASSPV